MFTLIGYASVDTLGAVITPLSTLYNPSVALWLRVGVRVRPCQGAWWASASMSNVARMHAMEVPWASGIARVHGSILSAHGTFIACILATLLMLALTRHALWQGLTFTPTLNLGGML